ncbi:MAG: CBS domain-containing protein [Acinetobacter sp.]
MKACEIMTLHPVTVTEETPVREIVERLLQLRISGMPVINEKGEMTGMVTEGDLLRRKELGTEVKRPHWLAVMLSTGKLAREYTHSHASFAKEIMTPDPVSVAPDLDIENVVELMEKHHIKRVPVVQEGKLLGIITRVDIIRALQRSWVAPAPYSISDEMLRQRILDKIADQPWVLPGKIHVEVKDGLVSLYGRILDEAVRGALITLAEEANNGNKVWDHLIYVEPLTGLFLSPDDENNH